MLSPKNQAADTWTLLQISQVRLKDTEKLQNSGKGE
jgi:hypothetical protein